MNKEKKRSGEWQDIYCLLEANFSNEFSRTFLVGVADTMLGIFATDEQVARRLYEKYMLEETGYIITTAKFIIWLEGRE